MNLELPTKSRNIVFIKRDDSYLAIAHNPFSFSIINEKCKKDLEYLIRGKSIEELKQNGMGENEINNLFENGLIEIDGKCKIQEKIDYSHDLSLVVLHTSNNCNFQCRYCYANTKQSNYMSSHVGKKVIDRLIEGKKENVCLEFHGGEPLLNFRFIREIVDYRKNKDANSVFSIQTNGSLIDKEKAKFLKENNFKVGLSLDGNEMHNDRNRVYRDGRGTFKDIMKGIEELREEDVNFGLISVITENDVLDNMFEFLTENQFYNIKFNPFFKQGRGKEKDNLDVKTYSYKMLDLLDKVINFNLNNERKIKITNISNLLRNLITNKRNYMCMRCPCGAGMNMLGIDINGDVYPCEEMNGKRELIVGNTLFDSFDEIFNNYINKRLRDRKITHFKDCADCIWREVCEVNCANKSYNKTGSFCEKSDLCEYYKIMFENIAFQLHSNFKGIITLL